MSVTLAGNQNVDVSLSKEHVYGPIMNFIHGTGTKVKILNMSKALATKNVAAVLLAVAMVFGFAFAFATPAKADATSDLQAQVTALLAQIQALQGTTSSNAACVNFTFTSNLAKGKTSAEVMQIQKFLNQWADTTVSTSGAGSKGNETSYFGAATKSAVIKFQNKYAADILTPNGLSAGNGNWYASTRAKANAIAATCVPGSTTGGTTGGTTTGGNLVVTAGTQPANSLAPASASRVPFTTFTITNTTGSAVTVNGVTVQRTGLANDAVFSGVVLVDSNGIQLGTSRTFDTNHQATIGDTFTIGGGQSMTFTVAGNMQNSTVLANYAGQVAGLSVVGINTSATVSGSLPISGAQQTINSTLSVGSATLAISSLDPQTSQTKNIGDTAVKLAGIRLTSGSAEDIKLFSVRFRLNGSAGTSDISNVVTQVNGVSYPTTVSADGRYYTATIAGGLLITKGNSVDVVAQADITGSNASGRTIELDIDRASDIYIVGQTYGYGITPAASSYTTSTQLTGNHTSALVGTGSGNSAVNGQPVFQGSVIVVSGASVTTISRATEVPAQNIAVNVSAQPLGGFVADIRGEDLTVNTMVFHVATSSANQGLLTNVTLVNENGVVVAGPVDATAQSSGIQKITFNNAVTVAAGRHIYTLKGTVASGSTTGGTFSASFDPSSDFTGVTGRTTGNSFTFPSGTITLNTMTIRGAALNITASSQPAAQTIVSNGQGVTLANIQLDASQSGEDVRVSSLPIYFSNITGLSSCQLFNGSTALNGGSNIVTPSTTAVGGNNFVFDNSLVVAKGTVVTLAVKCNLNSASGTYTVGVPSNADGAYSATGVQSGNALVESTNLTATAGTSGAQLVGSSTLVVSTDPSSPSYAIVAGGSTGTNVGAFKLHAAGEDMSIQEIGLTGASSPSTDITRVTIWDGATQVGSAIFAGNATVATSTLSTPVTVTKDTDKVLTFKVDVSTVGTGQSGTGGHTVSINFSGARATGVQSGTTIYASGSTATAGVRLERSYPVVAQVTSLTSNGVGDGRLMRFSVTANAAGSIGLQQFAFQIASSTVTSVTSLKLYGYTDSGFSTPVSSAAGGGQLNTTGVNVTGSTAKIVTDSVNGGVLEVGAGQTYYFELRGTVAGVQTGTSVSTTLLGDSSYVRGATSTLDGSYNFVWSPNSTTTASYLDSDFANGAGVLGLPSSGFTQTRSN